MDNIIVFLNGPRGVCVVKKIKNLNYKISKLILPLDKKYDELQFELNKIGLDCLRIGDVNSPETISMLKSLKPNLFIIAGFSTIFKKNLIDIPKKGTINLHAGRLPKYRGGSPLNWQIINGEDKAGISIIKVDENIDTGPIIAESQIKIEKKDTIADLHNKVNIIFPEILIKVLSDIELDKVKLINQNNKNAIYWHQRRDQDGHLNFQKMTVCEAERFVRALTFPYPGAWSYLDQKKIRFYEVEIPKIQLHGTPGKVCFVEKKGPYIICKDKALLVKNYLFENNKKLKLTNGVLLN